MSERLPFNEPSNWSSAFAALPPADPPPDGWERIVSRLQSRRRRRLPAWFAVAAALVLAIALPWKLLHDDAPVAPAVRADASPSAVDPSLETLYARSAQLEALLRYARDDRVSSGSAAAVSVQLAQQVASIDAALAQPRLSKAEQRSLWRQRVNALRTLANFESNRRLLSARGERYDGVLVRVD